MNQRPLSPHLQVYRFGLGMTVSILHRATGIALSVGLLVGVFSLLMLSQGAGPYAHWVMLMNSPLGVVVRVGLFLSLLYHTLSGLRHLWLDTGRGLERAQARRSARWVLIGFATLAVVLMTVWISGGGL
jgi:succinate dehydrogenase / fumarate reductase cytochrome b subunit